MSGGERSGVAGAWSAARQRAAGLALLTAAATAALAGAAGSSSDHVIAAGAYLGIAGAAVFFPGWVPAQVVVGQILAASLLLGATPAPLPLVGAVLAGVIATTEFLAAAARLESPRTRLARRDLRRPATAALAGSGVFMAIIVAGRLAGGGGTLAVGLAAAACVLVAWVLAERAEAVG